jgi:hypothetical protein
LKNGVTGFIVNSEHEAAKASLELSRLDRNLVRAEFDRRFTARHMALNYLKLYTRLAKIRKAAPLYGTTLLPRSALTAQATAIAAGPGIHAAAGA